AAGIERMAIGGHDFADGILVFQDRHSSHLSARATIAAWRTGDNRMVCARVCQGPLRVIHVDFAMAAQSVLPPKLGHRSMQAACLKGAMNRLLALVSGLLPRDKMARADVESS